MLKGKYKRSTCKAITKVIQGGGTTRSSVEAFVMKVERRGGVIQISVFSQPK